MEGGQNGEVTTRVSTGDWKVCWPIVIPHRDGGKVVEADALKKKAFLAKFDGPKRRRGLGGTKIKKQERKKAFRRKAVVSFKEWKSD